MTASTRSLSANAAQSCGCGASGGKCGCGCGPAGSAACPDGAFARPRFFSGQLLTQEDLQLVVDYVVGKSRLHNRFLFGEGVVCGLSVTCPPCGDGTLVVAPGYALDCCGNDIFLPCPTEVNVNALVRDLRKRQLDGWDCGDPCAKKICRDPAEPRETEGEQASPTYHYCLYIRYRETAVAPVAPYVSDEPCGAITCEPSRICEGYAFELRCESERPGPVDLLTRLRACVGDLQAAAATAQKAQANSARAFEIRSAGRLARGDAPPVEEADLAAMKEAAGRLARPVPATAAAADEEEIRSKLADYQVLTVGAARIDAVPAEERSEAMTGAATLARETLAATGEGLAHAAASAIAEPVARMAAENLVALARRHVLDSAGAARQSTEARLLRAGAPISAVEIERMRADAAELKAYLQERLLKTAAITSCELLDRLHRIRLPEAEDGVTNADVIAAAAEELGLILLETFRDCLCLALNPQCAPCDDPALLLACVDVRDCEVVDICNMGRRFVLSPAALRYWLPPVTELGRLVEKLCCEFEFRRPRQEHAIDHARLNPQTTFYARSAVPGLVATRIAPEARQAAVPAGIAVGDFESAAVLGSHLGAIGLSRSPSLETLVSPLRSNFAGLRARAKESVAATAREEADRIVGERLEAQRMELSRGVDQAIEAHSDAILERVLKEVRSDAEPALGAEQLAAALGAADAVTKLQTENRNLRLEIKKLADRVKSLKG